MFLGTFRTKTNHVTILNYHNYDTFWGNEPVEPVLYIYILWWFVWSNYQYFLYYYQVYFVYIIECFRNKFHFNHNINPIMYAELFSLCIDWLRTFHWIPSPIGASSDLLPVWYSPMGPNHMENETFDRYLSITIVGFFQYPVFDTSSIPRDFDAHFWYCNGLFSFNLNHTWKNVNIPTAITTPTDSPKLKIHNNDEKKKQLDVKRTVFYCISNSISFYKFGILLVT